MAAWRRITLAQLGGMDHPLLAEGNFSIFNDDHVCHSSSTATRYSTDIDGICLLSRYLDAFHICPFGETRVYTNARVDDQYKYIYKSNFFNLAVYDTNHRQQARYCPGFNFLDMLGAQLKVLGILNKRSVIEEVEEMKTDASRFARFFYLKVLNEAILKLNITSRTRKNNLALKTKLSGSLPKYYRLYPEDVDAIAAAVTAVISSLPSQTPYKFHFIYYKYGQQQILTQPLSLTSTNLHHVVSKESKIDFASCHIALSFSHHSEDFSVFWDREKTFTFLPGADVKKYPLMGLSEIGNITSKFPCPTPFLTAWPIPAQSNIHIPYAQAYTPFTKPMDNSRPFHDHPFLLAMLLGRDYIRGNEKFRHVVECTEKLKEYSALREAIILQLSHCVARFEVVVTSRKLADIFLCDTQQLARKVRSSGILVQVPKDDLHDYSKAVIKELLAPLQAAYSGAIEQCIPTVLLCESIFALLPTMSLKDQPYQLLKDYRITPIESGVMSLRRRLCLTGIAREQAGLLHVPRTVVHRVFVPLGQLPAEGRRQAVRLITFLEEMRTRDTGVMAVKAASILISQFVEELVSTHIIRRAAVLKNARSLTTSGCSVHSAIPSIEYARKLFNPAALPAQNRLTAFLRTALSLIPEQELYLALAKRLMAECVFVPRVVHHESSIDIQSTSFYVLTETPLPTLIRQIRTRGILKDEATPILRAVEATYQRFFNLPARQSREMTKFSPRRAAVIAGVMRTITLSSQRAALAAIGFALLELAKSESLIPRTFNTRGYQRAVNLNRTTTMAALREVVRRSSAGDIESAVRPFSIHLHRVGT